MIDVYRGIDGKETVVHRLADDNASVTREIMGREEVSIDITADSPLDIRVGDFVRVDGVTYTLNREVTLEKRSDVEYRYTMVFESPLYRLLDKILTHPITGVSAFTISRTLGEWLRIVVDCVNTIDPGWTVATGIPDTDPRNVLFEDTSCREALSRLAGEFGMEYYLSGREVHLIDRIENATGLVFEQGRGKGLYTVTREPVDTENTVTRLYPYGGTANMSPGEGDANGRLYLPERYLENFSEYGKVVEKVVVFEDIFPCFRGSVRSVSGESNRVITCPEIDFDISKQAIGGVKAKINFLSGDLMGESFELNWNNDKKQIDLVRKEDETALADKDGKRPLIPHDLRKAAIGDTFNLTDITMPPSYKDTAVALLRKKATDWLSYRSRLRVRFSLEIDHRYLRGKRVLMAGDLVTVRIPEAGVDKLLRVNSVERNLKTGKMSCSVSNYLDEKWEKKIEGVISDLRNTISGGGGGGTTGVEIIEEHDGTEPTNRNVYSAKRTDKEIRESEAKADERFLNKVTTAKQKVAAEVDFESTIKAKDWLMIGDFIKSMVAGKGAGIDKNGNAQVESIEVRSYMKVMELIFNRLSAMEGDYSFTESGTIETAELTAEDTYVLTLRRRWDLDFTAFDEHDILYGVVNNLLTSGEYYTSWMRVIRKDTSANQITVVMYQDSEVPAKRNFAPVKSMNLTRRGNALNEGRQDAWYISSYEGCIMYLQGVTKPILEENNYALTVGKPKHLELFNGLPINYDHPYLFARGAIIQDLFRVDYQGRPVQNVIDRGLWRLAIAISEPYRNTATEVHESWHNSCKYRCIVDQTQQEPRWNATDWLMVSGDPTLHMELDSSNGLNFMAGQVDTIISALVYKGVNNITGDIQDTDWEWTRITDDLVSDTLWNSEHAQSTSSVHLTDADMGLNALTTGKCTFTCIAYVRDINNTRIEQIKKTFDI